jgi:hypothetical protein
MENKIVSRPDYPCGSFDDFNKRGDIIPVMLEEGWTINSDSGDRIMISRPGVTDNASGNYHKELKTTYFHTTSTDFEPKAYSQSQVFAILKCGGDLSKASQMLYDIGYGTQAGAMNQIEINADPTVFTEEDKLKYEQMFAPMSEEQLMEYYKNKPDDIYSGFMIKGKKINYPSGLISVVNGLPGHGKTTFKLNSFLQVSHEAAYLGFEENRGILIPKALGIYIGLNIEEKYYPLSEDCKETIDKYFRTGSLEHFDSDHLAHFKQLKDLFFKEHIDNGRLKILAQKQQLDELLRSIYYLKGYTDVKVVFIDYIQKIYTRKSFRSRSEELAKICQDLEEAADKTGFAIVLGSQYNREAGSKSQLAINKTGGATEIEQTCKLYISIWNDDAPQNKNDEDEANDGKPKKQMTIQILKNNFGQTVGMKDSLFFDGNTGVIRNSNERIPLLKGQKYY